MSVSTGRLFEGLRADVSRRAGWYASDWRDGLHGKVVASAAFLFFACIAPAVAFGGLMSLTTGGAMGAIEMLVSTAVCGVAYALLSGQPLTILGGTGPLLVFTGLLYQLCERLGVPFLPAYACVGLWTSVFLVGFVAFGLNRYIARFTRFTDETFAALISLIFIVQALQRLLANFPNRQVHADAALLSLSLAATTYVVAARLSRLRQGPYLRPWIREFLSDFGPVIAVVVACILPMLIPDVTVPTLDVPSRFTTTSGRAWLVDPTDAPRWVWAAAALPAALVSVLVYLDQNITTRLVNSAEHRLEKGAGYDLDMAVVAALFAVTSLFGLPWLVAATVRSLNHVRSLATTAVETSADGSTQLRIVSVRENRLSALLVHLLVGVSLLVTGLLRRVPTAVLFGLFLYMGVTSMKGNQLFERLSLWIRDPAQYPQTYYLRRVPPRTVHAYTAVQLAGLAVLWVVKASSVGILFPIFIALLVPLRNALPRWFDASHLAILDAEQAPRDEEERLAE